MGKVRNYSVETNVRLKAIATIAVASVLIAILIHDPLEFFIDAVVSRLPWLEPIVQIGLLAPIEPMFIFWGLWAGFNRYAWRIPILISWHGIPNLNGVWNGTYESTYLDDEGKPTIGTAKVTIRQSFTTMCVWAQFSESSESYASVIGLTDCDAENQKSTMVFSYENHAIDKSLIVDSNRDNAHLGFTVLRFTSNEAIGTYVTFRNLATRGRIDLTRN